MASKEANISSLYTELSRFGQGGEYERGLKTANKILQQAPDEEEAFHCKIVCLIQLNRFQEALQAINKQTKLSKNLIFEKAYCQYRLNQPGEALKTINTSTTLDQKLKELKAQVLYRLEQYEECFDAYRDVIKNSSDDYENEREANLSAVVANLCIKKSNKDLPKLKEHTFELVYNAACQLVGRNQYAEAEKKLKAAEKLCRETLEEDGTPEEDIEMECGIIRGQIAYCLQMLGREKEAQSIYNAILKSKPSDIGLVAVASNNSATINRDQNIFDSKKKMKSATAEGIEHKLTALQKKCIAFNQCLLTVYTNQTELGKQLCDRLAETYPDCAADAVIIQAVQLARDNKIKEAAALLEKSSKKYKDRELDLKLASVQLLLNDGDRMEACRVLESLQDSGYRPGIISALVTLHLAENNREKASTIFKNAVEWYRNNKKSKQGDLSALWRQAADFHLRSGEPLVAANSLEELLRLNPGDNKTLAQLVIAYAQFDPAKAQNLSKQLPQLKLSNSSEVETLETSNWMMGTKVIKKVAKVEASPKPGTPGNDELIQKKKKKKKKTKLPKNYVEGVMPDPERWLPKHERTGYRKKKDRRNKDVMKGTQGAATGASDMYDITKMPSAATKSSPNPNSPAATESHGPRQQQRKFQQKKKKKAKTSTSPQNYQELKIPNGPSSAIRSRLTLQDSDFIDGVESDVRSFIEKRVQKRVLVFPPVNNYRRFLIHKLIEEQFESLKTFSIGEGDDRRTVICFKQDYIEPQVPEPKVARRSYASESSFSRKLPVTRTPPANENSSGDNTVRAKRARTMPSVSIYRPPAARRLENENGNSSRESVTEPGKDKPKSKSESSDDTGQNKKSENSGISMFRNAITSIKTQNQSPKCTNNKVSENNEKKVEENAVKLLKQEESVKNMNNTKQRRRPDMQVYVPKGRRIADTTKTSVPEKPVKKDVPVKKDEEKILNGDDNVNCQNDSGYFGTSNTENEKSSDEKSADEKSADEKSCDEKSCDEKPQLSKTSVWIESQNEPKTDTDKKTNNSSQPYDDSDSTVVSSSDNSSSNSLRNSCEKISDIKDSNKKTNNNPVHLNPDECDWETMFDDSGECLDPSLLEQLSTAVGQVAIENPKSNYDEYKTKSLDMIADEFPHVIEIYNFPPEFQLQDLMMVFSQFKNSGFEIKWVDDTHALGIFSSSKIVSEVLAFHHPFVKTRSLKEGTPLSKTKARRSAESLLPYKPRPDTCPALARRLVTGALGVRLPTSREEREAEKKILKIAREKKKLEAKQKEEAWEGTFS